jgi:hypothetical protein
MVWNKSSNIILTLEFAKWWLFFSSWPPFKWILLLPYTRYCNCLLITITLYTLLTSLFCISYELRIGEQGNRWANGPAIICYHIDVIVDILSIYVSYLPFNHTCFINKTLTNPVVVAWLTKPSFVISPISIKVCWIILPFLYNLPNAKKKIWHI